MYGRTCARYLALFVVVILTCGSGYDSGAALDAYIAPYVTSHDFSGTLLVARGSDVLYQKNVGFADIQAHEAVGMHTRFLVGSIAKTFTAAGIESLARDGKLSYDDPLSRWVPEYRYAGQITLRQLLDHAAGVPDYYSIARFALDRQKRLTLPEIARWLNAFPLDFKPGSHNKYSNSGYSLLALVIERASGSPYAVFLQRRIFDPLGMHDSGAFIAGSTGDLATGYEAAPPPAYLEVSHSIDPGWFVGNGYVYTTATDLSRWLDAANAGTVVNFKSLPYAYGWGVHKEGAYTLLEQSGRIPGFTSYISIDPANGLKVIALSNIQDDAAGKISNDVRALALGAAVCHRGESANVRAKSGCYARLRRNLFARPSAAARRLNQRRQYVHHKSRRRHTTLSRRNEPRRVFLSDSVCAGELHARRAGTRCRNALEQSVHA